MGFSHSLCGFNDTPAGLVAQGTEEEGVGKSNVPPPPPPLVDTFPAIADDEPPAEKTLVETVMEDVSLVDDSDSGLAVETQSLPPTAATATSNGDKHPLKTLWKKATKKFTPADPPTALSSSIQSSDAEQTGPSRFSGAQQSIQQPEDEMQLTLSEETDE